MIASIRNRKRFLKPITVNRMLYLTILAAVGISALIYGERMLYVSLVVLVGMPAISFTITFVMIMGLRISQEVPLTIVKDEPGVLTVRLHNISPMPFSNVEIVFFGDEIAVKTQESLITTLSPFKITIQEIPFQVLYRGQYQLGLRAVQATDIMGLFNIRRRYGKQVTITALPKIIDLSHFPLAMNLLTQAHSRFDIRDEDYATISDIRQYQPTDSIKRVHWKLTAKRNEWLVKIFQSNALNQVTLILDSLKHNLPAQERYPLEDRMVEMSLSLAKFCLSKGMPVNYMVTNGQHVNARAPQEFEVMYKSTGSLHFETVTTLNPLVILTHALNEATGYINAVLITTELDRELYERVLHAHSNGHYIAVLYYPLRTPKRDCEQIVRLLNDSGLPCFRIPEGSESGLIPV